MTCGERSRKSRQASNGTSHPTNRRCFLPPQTSRQPSYLVSRAFGSGSGRRHRRLGRQVACGARLRQLNADIEVSAYVARDETNEDNFC